MKKLIHRITGVEMLVADDQLDSFLAAGHRLAASAEKPAEAKPVVAEKPKEQPKVEKPKAKATTTKKSVSKSKK